MLSNFSKGQRSLRAGPLCRLLSEGHEEISLVLVGLADTGVQCLQAPDGLLALQHDVPLEGFRTKGAREEWSWVTTARPQGQREVGAVAISRDTGLWTLPGSAPRRQFFLCLFYRQVTWGEIVCFSFSFAYFSFF